MAGRPLPSPTPTGRAVAAAGIVVAALGIVLGYVAFTVIAAGAFAALIVGWLLAVRIPSLDVDRQVEPLRVQRGRAAMALLVVGNAERRRSRACTAIERLPTSELAISIPRLRAGRSVSIPYRLPTQRRGALSVGPLAIVRTDPFGLWTTQRDVGATTVVLVLPRLLPVDPRPGGRTQHLEGPVSETAPRGTLTFHSLREYVRGDDIRRVHWRTTARTGTLMVREHVDTSQPSTVVVLDTRRQRYPDDTFEDAVDVAASIVDASQQRGFPVRLVTTLGETHLVRAGHHGQQLADFLAAVQPVEGGDLRHAAVAALAGRDHDVVIVVSGDVDAGDLAVTTQLTRRFGYRALVTVRAGRTEAPTWSAGTHLAGSTAVDALARWLTHRVAA